MIYGSFGFDASGNYCLCALSAVSIQNCASNLVARFNLASVRACGGNISLGGRHIMIGLVVTRLATVLKGKYDQVASSHSTIIAKCDLYICICV